MAGRNKGIFGFSANFEPQIAAPIDARSRVSTYVDLVTASTWLAHDNNSYAFPGMIVSVFEDSTAENNGVYRLKALPTTSAGNWEKIGTTLSPNIDTSINNTTLDIEGLDISTVTEGALKYDYFIFKTGGSRAGTIMVTWADSNIEQYETSTLDIGDTTDFTWDASIAATTLKVEGATTGNYTKVKLIRTQLY